MPKLAPQEVRTFFVTTVAADRRPILRSDRMANLLIDVMRENAGKGRMAIHEFVVMPDHLHAIVTPASDQSLEKCLQFVKGGFSFRAKRELLFKQEIWQASFTEHRIVDARDYEQHRAYIYANPVERRLVAIASEWPYSSIHRQDWLVAMPAHFRGSSPAVKSASSPA